MAFTLSTSVWVDDTAPQKASIRNAVARSQLADLPTRTEAASLTIPAAVLTLVTSGETTAGDGLGGRFMRVDADPGSVEKFRSVDRFLSDGTVDATNGGYWRKVRSGPRINTQAGNYTIQLSDFDRPTIIEVTGAGTVTLPAGMPSDGVVIVERIGAGAVTVQAAGGVDLNGTTAGSKAISAQYDALLLRARGSDDWVARGTASVVVEDGDGFSSGFSSGFA